jgi:FKBP-type peptidyl-prolyl cis-trans isomerase 2
MWSGGSAVREVFVDYNRVGWAKRAHTRLFRDEREGLEVGEVVMAVGDAVDPRPARVISIDGSDVELEFLEPLADAG